MVLSVAEAKAAGSSEFQCMLAVSSPVLESDNMMPSLNMMPLAPRMATSSLADIVKAFITSGEYRRRLGP